MWFFSNSATTLPERSLHSKLAAERMGSPKLCLPSLSLKIVPFSCRIPGGASGKEPACQCRIHKTRIAGHGQYSCLENPMNRGAGRAIVHRVSQSQTRLKQLGMHTHTLIIIAPDKKSVAFQARMRSLNCFKSQFRSKSSPKMSKVKWQLVEK